MKLDLSKYEKLEAAKARREKLVAEHAEQLAAVDAEIAREMLVLGMGEYRAPGQPKKVLMSEVKKQQHAEVRAEAVRRGWFHTTGRKKGQPDVERVRLHRKAEALGISVEALAKREAEAKVKKLSEKLKPVKAAKR